ncbi:hypothetical protein RvY_12681 [Ramazzottius varieornatus]|uniref:Maelstrom domain-containing protein n=1 Tax=Ramazzottius varieornatus TaxID=947166 RepID=A0A1D1VKC8_RAMVA|nr:hypothetical protein RvY_12681 [Ramazzottius varieornatus]
MAAHTASTSGFGGFHDAASESGHSVASGSTFSGKKKGYKSKARGKNEEGLTPEQVHELRYIGIRFDTTSDVPYLDEDEPSVAQATPVADTHFHLATRKAEKALSSYRILMMQEILEMLMGIGGKFDDLGAELFAVMHLMRAFMGKRPDYAPIEVTAFRIRLATGVEPGMFHTFPSPLPLPFGKSADFQVGRKELHEMEEDTFDKFDDDFIDIFRGLLLTFQPRGVPRKNLSNYQGKYPLVICQSHAVNKVVMMFEYLHQRALLAQKAKLPTKAPAEFIVPETVPLSFCELRAFDAALRHVFRTLGLVADAPQDVNVGQVNHCEYHKTTNKLTCTTYMATDILEQLMVFSYYWGIEAPNRCVEAFRLDRHLDFTDIRTGDPSPTVPKPEQKTSETGSVPWASDTEGGSRRTDSPSSADNNTDETNSQKSSTGSQSGPYRLKPRAVQLQAMAPHPVRVGRPGSVDGTGSVVSSATGSSISQQASVLAKGMRSRLPQSLDFLKPKKVDGQLGQAAKNGPPQETPQTVPSVPSISGSSIGRSVTPQEDVVSEKEVPASVKTGGFFAAGRRSSRM